VGASLSDSLARIGHDVAVIDRDSTAFHRLSPEFTGERVLGMGFDRDVLLRAGIEEAGAFAAVSSGDNSNIISARVAREWTGTSSVDCSLVSTFMASIFSRSAFLPTVSLPDGVIVILSGLDKENPPAQDREIQPLLSGLLDQGSLDWPRDLDVQADGLRPSHYFPRSTVSALMRS